MSLSASPCASDSLEEAAIKVLLEGNPWKKAEYGRTAATLWKNGEISVSYSESRIQKPMVPERPSRDDTVRIVAARDIGKRGKGGSLSSRQNLLHSLVHIESWAIDLSWDIIARFGRCEEMPRAFFDDFVQVAEDEGRHFTLLAERLSEIGSKYGDHPGHEGLWDSAAATAGDLKARLAVEHCVHEARGLDIVPQTIARFRAGGDDITANILQDVIYPEEITHCAAGVKWFSFLCQRELAAKSGTLPSTNSAGKDSPGQEMDYGTAAEQYCIAQFHEIVRKHFRGHLKPPFNEEARSQAGFRPEWYLPLAIKS